MVDWSLDKWCHVFIARIPALFTTANKLRDTVSFESACLPGYFVRQRNYRFFIQKNDGTDLFGKVSDLLFGFPGRISMFRVFVFLFSSNILFTKRSKEY